MRIALLEDDPYQAQLTKLWLTDAGHYVVVYKDGRTAVRGILNDSFDLLILDWMVPIMDGLEVLRWVRENVEWPIPALFITQRDTEHDVVTALEQGADDYMAKPIKHYEMLARIKAISRRTKNAGETNKTIAFHPYLIDREKRRVKHNGDQIYLTDKEFDLALFLFRNAGRVLSRGHLLESVWGRSSVVNTRTVDTHISRLRRKLNLSSDSSGWKLTSIYQHGYRLERTTDLK